MNSPTGMPWDPFHRSTNYLDSALRFGFVTMTPFFGVTKLSKYYRLQRLLLLLGNDLLLLLSGLNITCTRHSVVPSCRLQFDKFNFITSSKFRVEVESIHQFLRGIICLHYYGNNLLLLSGSNLYLPTASTPDPSRQLRLDLFHFVLAPTYHTVVLALEEPALNFCLWIFLFEIFNFTDFWE